MSSGKPRTGSYPTTFPDIARWSGENGVPIGEGRVRYAQFTILASVARSRDLSKRLVFKGGNALDFIWQPNRSTRDLDFSFDDTVDAFDLDSGRLYALLQRQLDNADRTHGVMLAVHRVQQRPPGPNRSLITYEARIGFALPDEARLRLRMQQGEPSVNVVPLDVSMNEVICAAEIVRLASGVPLRVCTIEDILAEKLRALLQQPIRGRDRRQDLLDVAVILEARPGVDPLIVADFLVRKANARQVAVSKRAFRDPNVIGRASRGYDALEATTRRRFISLLDATDLLFAFVDRLGIPD